MATSGRYNETFVPYQCHQFYHVLVVVVLGQLEQLGQVGDIASKLLVQLERLGGVGPLAHHLLSDLGVVPEALGEAEVVEPVDRMLQPRRVKDTSPAHRCAVQGRPVGRGILPA